MSLLTFFYGVRHRIGLRYNVALTPSPFNVVRKGQIKKAVLKAQPQKKLNYKFKRINNLRKISIWPTQNVNGVQGR